MVTRDKTGSVLGKIKDLEAENTELRRRIHSMEDIRVRLGELSERLNVVHRICERLNTFDLARITSIATKEIPEFVGARYCSLYVYDYANNDLVLQGHNHTEDITSRIHVSYPPSTIMEVALQKKDTVYVVDIEEFQREYKIAPLQRRFKSKYNTRSFVSSPLIVGGEKSRFVVGILNFADRFDGEPFDEANDVSTIKQLSHFLALAIKNCRLFNEVQQQARQDSLTRLFNYRGFHETLLSEIHRSLRYSRPLTLLMYDIDNFKQINDKFGHQAGDHVLSEIGKIFRRQIRREDLAARYGGDEIALILPETEASGAEIISSRLKEMITNNEFVISGNKTKITVSCGVALFKPNQSISDFIGAADQALYEAKQKGKNTVVFAQ